MIKLTESARKEILEMMKNSGFKNPALRVTFAGYG